MCKLGLSVSGEREIRGDSVKKENVNRSVSEESKKEDSIWE